MHATARELYDTLAQHVGHTGTCDEPTYFRALNNALRLLWNRGDWEDTMSLFAIGTSEGGEFCLPWGVESIKNAWSGPDPVHTYDWTHHAVPDLGALPDGCDPVFITDLHRSVVTPCTIPFPCHLGILFDSREPAGTKVVLHFRDNKMGANKVFESAAPCHEEPACDLMEAFRTEHPVSSIEAVTKPVTKFDVTLVASPQASGPWTPVIRWSSRQANPSYRLYRITGRATRTLWAYVKLKCPQVIEMDDPVPLANPIALAWAIRAINAIGTDNKNFEECVAFAERELIVDRLDRRGDRQHSFYVEQADRPVNLLPRGFPR